MMYESPAGLESTSFLAGRPPSEHLLQQTSTLPTIGPSDAELIHDVHAYVQSIDLTQVSRKGYGVIQ